MRNLVPRLGALLAAALLAGCASMGDQGSGVQQGASVTRFHLGQPIARGAIRVEPADPAEANSLAFAQIAAPVERELTRLGWTLATANAHTEQVAVVRADQSARLARRGGSSIGIGVGGGTGGYRSGVGVGVGATIPVGRRSGEIVVTELGVRIQRRSDATVHWEGRAQMEARAGTPLAQRGAAINRLAGALFQDFPGESGRTIRIR